MNNLLKTILIVFIIHLLTISAVMAQNIPKEYVPRPVLVPQDTGSPDVTTETTIDNQFSNMTKVRQYEESYYVDLSQQYKNKEEPPEELSDIEKMFNLKNVKQFGYDIFGQSASAAVGGLPSRTHTVSRGDQMTINFWGDTLDLLKITGSSALEPSVNAVVDADGTMFIPGVGLIYAEGRTVMDIQNEIQSQLSQKYKSVSVDIGVQSPGSISVIVMGKVKKPGTVNVTANETFLDAISRAQGVLKTGSLRNIIHIDSFTKKKTLIDLYKLLAEGDYPNIYLNQGDVVLVKPIGKVVALAEGVKTPAIYEFKDKESLAEILKVGGGLLPSMNPKAIEVEKYDVFNGQKSLQEMTYADFNGYFPKDGDMIKFNPLFDYAENIVTLEGHVKHPRTFEYKENMRLSDVLPSRNELMVNTYTEQAVITRVDGLNKGIIQLPVSLNAFFDGSTDPVLKPMDIIKVYPSTKMGVIEVAGKVKNPSYIPFKDGMTLKDVLSVVKLDANPNDLIVEITKEEEKSIKGQPSLDKETLTGSVYLYELMTLNKTNLDVALKPGDKVMFRSVSNKELIKTVSVLGYVNHPGIFNIYEGMRLTDVIKMAGGLTPDAYLPGLIYMRPAIAQEQTDALNRSILGVKEDIAQRVNTLQSTKDEGRKADLKQFIENQSDLLDLMSQKARQDYGRIALNIGSYSIDGIPPEFNLEIRDGDQVVIPYRPQHVIIMGAVANQSAVAFLPDVDPAYYIDSVGGFTKEANKRQAYIIRSNGRTQHLKNFKSIAVEPGDSIIIPRKVGIPINVGNVIKSVLSTAFQTTGMVYMITNIK